jgi:DNA phosphorothioation-dependent restriction protein DptG
MKIERENEETLKKLERLLGQSMNTKDCVDRMIQKCSLPFYNEQDMKEDLKVISNNLDAIMNNIDPIFRLYLILPTNVENENG